MVFLTLLSMAALFVALPVALGSRARRDASGRWLPRAEGTVHVGAGSYRDAEVPRYVAEGAPREVHVAAIMAWVLGVMFVPGLLGGLVGLLAGGLGLVSIPGLMLAWRLFFLGGPMMRGEAEAAPKACAAASFARGLNYVVLTLCGLTTAFTLVMGAHEGFAHNDLVGTLLLASLVAVYAVISLAHAALLDRAANHIDAEQERRFIDTRRVRIAADAATHGGAAGDEVELDARREDLRRAMRGD